jgi:hypothetical protein
MSARLSGTIKTTLTRLAREPFGPASTSSVTRSPTSRSAKTPRSVTALMWKNTDSPSGSFMNPKPRSLTTISGDGAAGRAVDSAVYLDNHTGEGTRRSAGEPGCRDR